MDEALRARLERRAALLEEVRRWLVRTMHLRRGPDEIDPDVPLFGGGLGLDSIDAVDLIIALETNWNVRASEERLQRALRTVNAILDLIQEEGTHGT